MNTTRRVVGTLVLAGILLGGLVVPATAGNPGSKGFSTNDIYGEFGIASVGTAAFSTLGVVRIGGGHLKDGSFTIVIDQPAPTPPIPITCLFSGNISLETDGQGLADLAGDCDNGNPTNLKFRVVVTGTTPSGEVTSLRAIQLNNSMLGGLTILDLTKIAKK